MFSSPKEDSFANLPPIPIRFNNARLKLHSASFIGDVVSRHLQEKVTTAISLSQTHPFELSTRTSWAQHSEIALRVELGRDLLAEGEGMDLVANRPSTLVERDTVDRSERGDLDPSVAAPKTVNLKLRELERRGLRNPWSGVCAEHVEPMRCDR
jgi:hypothetical protein